MLKIASKTNKNPFVAGADQTPLGAIGAPPDSLADTGALGAAYMIQGGARRPCHHSSVRTMLRVADRESRTHG